MLATRLLNAPQHQLDLVLFPSALRANGKLILDCRGYPQSYRCLQKRNDDVKNPKSQINISSIKVVDFDKLKESFRKALKSKNEIMINQTSFNIYFYYF